MELDLTIRTPREISPYALMQEEFRDDPWKLLVGCIMLNQTSAKQARPVWERFFVTWPSPQSLLSRDDIDSLIRDITDVIRPLGFQNRRARSIWHMTVDYVTMRPDLNPSLINDVYGIGKYAADSFKIFVEGKIVIDVQDKELKNYVKWALEREEEVRKNSQ